MKKFLFLITLLTLLGGANSVKASSFRLYATSFSTDGTTAKYEEGKLKWTSTSNNVAGAINVEAGVIAKFSKIRFSCSDLTEGATYRVMLTTSTGTNYISEINTTGDVTVNFSDLKKQWGSEAPTSEVLATVTQVRIGGGTGGSPTSDTPYEITITPSSFCIESEGSLSIAESADWNIFSQMVGMGINPLDAELTADVNAGSTMVGTSEHPYGGTFDGNMNRLTVDYNSTYPCAAPFSYVRNATIQNLIVDGSIESSSTLIGGVAGQMDGTTTINNCQSSVAIISTKEAGVGDCNCGGIAAINLNGSNITVTNCLFDGSITSSGANAYCGIIGYLRSGTLTVKNNLVLGTLTGAYAESTDNHLNNIYRTYAEVTNSNNYYKNKFGTATDGTQASEGVLLSGEVAYNLQGEQETMYWGQDLKDAMSNPILTSNVAYKVFNAGSGEYANWTNTISNDADWVIFSKLVANGNTSLNATMTADVNAGNTMVGSDSDGKRYQGTFDGAGHTLTFNYTGSDTEVGPFKCVQAATFKDLRVAGTITSTGQLIAGLIGKNIGATTITRCISSVNLTTDHSDSRPGGFVGRSSADGANITFSYCVYDGKIDATKQGCGFVGWAAGQTMNVGHCLVASTDITGGENNFIGGYGTKNISDSYYLTKFGESTEGIQLTDQLRYSGQAAWTLNQGIGDGAWFFGQGKLNASNVEACPTLTTDPSKKVVRTKASGTSTDLYVNPGGAVPNAVRMRATGFSMTNGGEVVTNVPSSFTTDDVVIYRTSEKFIFNVSSAGATTLIVPFNVAELPDGMTAYNLEFDGENVTATPVSSITADKPVLINAPKGEYKFETGLTETIEDYASRSTTNGSLKGVYNEAGSSSASNPLSYVPAGAYVLQNQGGELGFYRVDAENSIKITSFRAYLTAPGSGARSIRIVYKDDITGVENVNSAEVTAQKSGKYFENGKIVIFKNGMKFNAAGAQIK